MFRPLLPSLALLALPLGVVAACSVSGKADVLADNSAGAGDPVDPSVSVVDSGQNIAQLEAPTGSSLCGVTTKSCSPDDDGKRPLAEGVQRCEADAGAGAAFVADAAPPVGACRIVKNAAAQSPSCAPSANAEGVDGERCKSASDCAAGFDCVDNEKGAVCRRYCCSGSCEGFTAANGGATFCDVQPVVRTTAAPTPDQQVKAPVCMPIKACTLFEEGGCGRKESCAVVVVEKGITGCVTNDIRKAGESCEDTHCAEGLTCLGSPGDKTCYKLCRTLEPADCGPTQKCTSGSTFEDTSFGVCKD